MKSKITFLRIFVMGLILAASFTVVFARQPTPTPTPTPDETEDMVISPTYDRRESSEPREWEVTGGTTIMSSLVDRNNGQLVCKCVVEKFWFDAETKGPGSSYYFVGAHVYKQFDQKFGRGDEAELQAGITGRIRGYKYRASVGFRSMVEEEDAATLTLDLETPERHLMPKQSKGQGSNLAFAKASIQGFTRFGVYSSADFNGYKAGVYALVGVRYRRELPNRSFLEAYVTAVTDTGLLGRRAGSAGNVFAAYGKQYGKAVYIPFIELVTRTHQERVVRFGFGMIIR